MNLHDDPNAFVVLVSETSDYFDLTEAIVEKDYYITFLLKRIMSFDTMVFKGGTSLSKCFKCVKRFSEDIDLSVLNKANEKKRATDSQRINSYLALLDVCQNNGFGLLRQPPKDKKKPSPRDRFHTLYIDFPSEFRMDGIEDPIRIELSAYHPAYPSVMVSATSYITDYLTERNNATILKQYGLEPFMVRVQTKEKTFIDKVFAICDRLLKCDTAADDDARNETILRSSRHIYDLYKLFKQIEINDEFTRLLAEVRPIRAKCSNSRFVVRSPSSVEGVVINDLLQRIVDERTYEEDYHSQTEHLLWKSEKVPYEEAITVLSDIINLGVF